MNIHTQPMSLQGGAGTIEALRDEPTATPSRGVAVLAHPHPLFAGTMHNKVVQTLARAAVQAGWTAIRFNFRGVGNSAGSHDHGVGECDDLLHVLHQVCPPDKPFCLGGFSFGAFVVCQAVARLAAEQPTRTPHAITLVGTAASRFTVAPIAEPLHARTVVIHGEADDVVPLDAVLDWARPQVLPVTVVPAAGHFFHGQLALLKRLLVPLFAAPAA